MLRSSLVAALACVFVGAVPSAAPGLASAASPTPTFAGCAGVDPQIRPRTILVACGDGNFYINGLVWSQWGPRRATGVGVGHENDCRPYCAAGHFHAYRVTVRLTRPEPCSSNRRHYTRFTYSFVGSTPAGIVARSHTLTAPFYTHSGCR